jgi:Ca2+-binding RTX toxin-like protein
MGLLKGDATVSGAAARVEPLEARTLLSGFMHLGADGVLTVKGTDGHDRISIRRDHDVTFPYEPQLLIRWNGKWRGVPRVRSIIVKTGAGNDKVLLDGNLKITRDPAPGSLYADVEMDDFSIDVPTVVKGGAGRDTLVGGTSQDSLYGGDGDDLLVGGGLRAKSLLDVPLESVDGRSDLIHGGGGNDRALTEDEDELVKVEWSEGNESRFTGVLYTWTTTFPVRTFRALRLDSGQRVDLDLSDVGGWTIGARVTVTGRFSWVKPDPLIGGLLGLKTLRVTSIAAA